MIGTIRTLFRRSPKYFLAAAIFIGSTAAFLIWFFSRPSPQSAAVSGSQPAVIQTPQVVKAETNYGHLVLADNTLYDLDTGEPLFSNWLREGTPSKISWEPASKTFLAEYDRGYVRFSADGKEVNRLMAPHPFFATAGDKTMLLCRDHDIWRAEVDWPSLKFINERKLTSVAQFSDEHFATNILAGTDDALLVRLPTQIVRVTIADGTVKPINIGLDYNSRRRSPDRKTILGVDKGQFYSYDLNGDEAKGFPIERGGIIGYQWLDSDRCAVLSAGNRVLIYDRAKNLLTDIVAVGSPCQAIGQPSPDGRYVFCITRNSGVLVDTEKKTASPVTAGAGVVWMSNDTYAFSREVPDSELRGIWLQTVGEGERRVSIEPYLVGKRGPMMLGLKAAGMVVMATRVGIATMKADGTGFKEIVTLTNPPTLVVAIQEWSQ